MCVCVFLFLFLFARVRRLERKECVRAWVRTCLKYVRVHMHTQFVCDV